MAFDASVITAFMEPKHLIIVVILYVLGIFLKKNLSIKDNYIPVILTVVSAIMCSLYTASSLSIDVTGQSIMEVIFNVIVQTFCCVAAAVYFNQMKKQLFDKFDPEDLLIKDEEEK